MIGSNKPQWLGKLFLTLSLAWLLVILGLSNHYLNSMLHPACEPAPKPPLGFVETKIPFQGQTLTGWWAAPSNGAIILLFGGHGANQAALAEEAQFLQQAGFGVLTTNYRHCLGQAVSFGWQEVEEFNAVYAHAQTLAPQAQLAAFGFSAGAIAAMRGAGLHPEIKALTAVGNYALLTDEIISRDAPFFSLRWQIEHAVLLLYELRTGLSPDQVNILPELEKIAPRPVLLIHGEYEQERSQAALQLRAAGKNARLWIAPHSDHGTYFQQVPEQYRETVINFFQQNLP